MDILFPVYYFINHHDTMFPSIKQKGLYPYKPITNCQGKRCILFLQLFQNPFQFGIKNNGKIKYIGEKENFPVRQLAASNAGFFKDKCWLCHDDWWNKKQEIKYPTKHLSNSNFRHSVMPLSRVSFGPLLSLSYSSNNDQKTKNQKC